jgi:hypothetical protein
LREIIIIKNKESGLKTGFDCAVVLGKVAHERQEEEEEEELRIRDLVDSSH